MHGFENCLERGKLLRQLGLQVITILDSDTLFQRMESNNKALFQDPLSYVGGHITSNLDGTTWRVCQQQCGPLYYWAESVISELESGYKELAWTLFHNVSQDNATIASSTDLSQVDHMETRTNSPSQQEMPICLARVVNLLTRNTVAKCPAAWWPICLALREYLQQLHTRCDD